MKVRVVLKCKDGGFLRKYIQMPFIPFPKLNITLAESLDISITVDYVNYDVEDGNVTIIVEKSLNDEIIEKLIKLGWMYYRSGI